MPGCLHILNSNLKLFLLLIENIRLYIFLTRRFSLEIQKREREKELGKTMNEKEKERVALANILMRNNFILFYYIVCVD